MTGMKTVWVDFNDIEDRKTTTLNKFASEPLKRHEVVICEDSDGMRCKGLVLSVADDGLVKILLALDFLEQ